MRQARIKQSGEAYYHVTSRCALQEYLFKKKAKDMFVKMMRRAEVFSCVEIVTYCVMDNHFHILVKVPERREISEEELKHKVLVLYGEDKAQRIFRRWDAFVEAGDAEEIHAEQDALRSRMFDISEFMKTFKQRFSVWYTANNKRKTGNEEKFIEGTIWQGRFSSVIVEPTQKALTAVAAYIDLNPVRAEIVEDAGDYSWSGYGAAQSGDSDAIAGRSVLEQKLFGEVIREKQGGFASRKAGLTSSAAFGSEKFVTNILKNTRTRSRSISMALAEQGKLAQLFTTGRRKKA